MNDWVPIMAVLAGVLLVVMIVRRLIRMEDKIDRLIATVLADLQERMNDRRH